MRRSQESSKAAIIDSLIPRVQDHDDISRIHIEIGTEEAGTLLSVRVRSRFDTEGDILILQNKDLF